MTVKSIIREHPTRASRTRVSARSTENGVVRARINEQIKNDASVVLKAQRY